ncbi:MAG: tetratricopeptide repeat protein [Fibromonadaceae bacterium]|nr:tetratricopeptide repeat protein [Fibromonadaceae bacterium]
MNQQFNNFLMRYENELKPFVVSLEKKIRNRLQNISKRDIILGIAIIGIVGVAIINYAIKQETNLNDPDYLFKRGYKYFSKEKYGKAIEDYTAALKIKPNNPNYLYGRGGAHLQNKDYYKAVADLTTALLLKPDHPPYLFLRGTAYLLMENYGRAIEDYEILLKIEPHYNTDARKNLELARRKIAAR